MIFVSSKNNNYYDFDWEKYSKIYSNLKNEGFITKDELWWHYLNIGESNGYIFYNINNFESQNSNKTSLNNTDILENIVVFDDSIYKECYPHLILDGYKTKEELFWHYIHIGKTKGYLFFNIKDKLENNKKLQELNIVHQLPINNNKLVNTNTNKKTLYYFIDHAAHDPIRTGIQVVSIYLAKEFVKHPEKYNFNIIFVKWNLFYKCLVPCDTGEINFFFNYNETTDLINKIEYNNNLAIHLNQDIPLKDCIFFCPELPFAIHSGLPEELQKYLKTYNIRNIYILYDIIPLVLPEYNFIHEGFKSYLNHNLIHSDKIITISDFTKDEFLKYVEFNKLVNNNFPIIKSVSLPYQYRNKPKITPQKQDIYQNKISILLPGTIESRKQQTILIKLFLKFIKEHPEINVELIIFGNIIQCYLREVELMISLSNQKIKYLGIIDNETLFSLYKNSNFLCFISKYEGYGFPISESLWHGLPVLTSNYGSMAEVAKIGGCYCVDTTNENEIYNALNNLIKNPLLIEKLKTEINSRDFTKWSDYGEKIYNEIMN